MSLASGDLNGDGKADMVVANEYTNNIGVLLGNGDGSFQPVQTYSSGAAEPYSVALADVNGDGKLDIIVANNRQSNSGSGTVGVLLGNGDGTFQPVQNYGSGGDYTVSVAVADTNGDGKPDLIAANGCSDNTCTGSNVGVLLGNGDGTFQAAQPFATGASNAFFVSAGDVNADGKADIVVATLNSSVSVLLGNGDGTFQPAQTYGSGGNQSFSVVIGDVNEDGKPDLLVANQCGDSTCVAGAVGVLLGNGDGTFQAARAYSTGAPYASYVQVGDLNGDGKADMAVVAESVLIIFPGNGDGTFQAGRFYASGGFTPAAVWIGDLNGDGKPDLAVANQCNDVNCVTGNVAVLLGNGNATFQAPSSYTTGAEQAFAAVLKDVNGDGKSDLILADICLDLCLDGGVSVLLGNGDGTFQPGTAFDSGGSEAVSVAVADLNGDGKADVVTANSGPGNIGVLLGNGDGSLQTAQTYPAGGLSAVAVAVADVTGDGKPDLAVANGWLDNTLTSGSFTVLTGLGDGTFQTLQTFPSGGLYASSIAVADLNGDGTPDIVLTNECADSNCVNGNLAVFLGSGGGTFQAPQTFSSGGIYTLAVAVADINGDGKLDLVVANHNSNTLGILLGNGDGTFQAVQVYPSGAIDPIDVIVNDVNGDGKVDLVVANTADASLLLGNGDGTFQTAQVYSPGAYTLAVGDLNGDGKPDAVFTSGYVATVLLNIYTPPLSATTTALASSVNPSSVGQLVTFTASVTASQGTPTGSVSFYDGTNLLGTATLSSGTANFSTSSLALGSHSVTATYSGDSHFSGSTSSVLSQIVNTAMTATQLSSSQNPSVYDQPVVLMAAVTGSGGIPTGSVTFYDGTTALGSSPLNNNGTASLSVSTLSVGSHSLTATYGGDSNFSGSTSTPLTQQVNMATSGTTLSSSANPTVVLSPVTFTAVVSPQFGGTASGTVTFMNGGKVLGTSPVTANMAAFTVTFVTTGSRSIKAVYSGDLNFSGSSSTTLTQQVNKAISTVTLTSSQNPSTLGQAVTFTATVSSSLKIPNGETVKFLDGAVVIGTTTTTSGVAKFSTSALAHGNHQIKAQYAGDGNIKPATSAILKQKVN